MKKLLLLFIIIMSVGCGSLENLTIETPYPAYGNISNRVNYRYGTYGYGYYDHFNRYYGSNRNYYRPIGPRIIYRVPLRRVNNKRAVPVKRRATPVKRIKRVVKGKGRRN